MEHESISARELAEKLEVSVRTINRDIEKLSEARIPIYATRGRSGGISLLSDFVLNKTVLSQEEKSSILSSMKLMGAVAYEDEKQALQRLEDFFCERSADWIEFELDNWSQGTFDKERFRQLKDAVLTRKKIHFEYNGYGKYTSRTVRPAKLVFKAQAWYLYAFCELRQEYRFFKLKRIDKLQILPEHFDPLILPKEEKNEYYIEEQNSSYNGAYEETGIECLVAIDKSKAYRAFDELPLEGLVEESDRYIFTIPNANPKWFFDYIFSYGPAAEVISPPHIRKEAILRVRQMNDKYALNNDK